MSDIIRFEPQSDFGTEPLGLAYFFKDPAMISTGSLALGFIGWVMGGPLAAGVITLLAANDLLWLRRNPSRSDHTWLTIDAEAEPDTEPVEPATVRAVQAAEFPPRVATYTTSDQGASQLAYQEAKELLNEGPLALAELLGQGCPDWLREVCDRRAEQVRGVMSGTLNLYEPEPEPMPEPTEAILNHRSQNGSAVQGSGSAIGSAMVQDAEVQRFRAKLRTAAGSTSLPENFQVKGSAYWLIWQAKKLGIAQAEVMPVFGVTKGGSVGYKRFKELWESVNAK